jgi:hypothetical protein
MGRISKSFALILILVMVVSLQSLIVIKLAAAQTATPASSPVPAPSVPEFTIKLVGPSYSQPTTYQLDQNTGKIMANIGYTNEYSSVEVTIKNQPLVFDYSNVHLIGAFGFYYNIQIKPHSSSGEWTDIYQAWNDGYGVPSNSEYTNLSFSIEGQMGVGVLAGTEIDIQVQAMIGSLGRDASYVPAPWVFEGQTSAWSNTQTISVPANIPLSATSSSPTPTSPPTQNPPATPNQTVNQTGGLLGLGWGEIVIITLLSVIAVLLVIVIVFLRKRTGKQTQVG